MSAGPGCARCNGCGLIANTENGEAWTSWTALPVESQVAVRLGLVAPIPCPVCAADASEATA